MALALPIPFTTSFLPPITPHLKKHPPIKRRAPATTVITAAGGGGGNKKIVRCPPLDRHASKHSRLRFATKLQTLLLSKPRRFLPIRVLSRCRRYLGLPPSRPLLPYILRYPSLFRLFHAPSHTSHSLSLLSVSLTPAALSLADHHHNLRLRVASSLASKLHRLLMLASPHHRLLLSKLAHLAPDLGLPANFRSRLCNAHPARFRTADTSYGRALHLVSWDPTLAAVTPPTLAPSAVAPIIDRPPKFKQLKLRKGLNLKRRHRDYLLKFHEMPEAAPYAPAGELTAAEAERRACAVVREVVGMTVERRTLVDHLTHFRREFGLPNRLRAMLVRHPEMFYVSVKGQRDSVFLVEAYDDKGKLLVEDELVEAKERLVELVREGKRMRRAERCGVGGDDEEEDEDEEEEEEEEDDDGLSDLFDSGIGEDWDDFDDFDVAAGVGDECGVENGEFWSRKASAVEWSGSGGLRMEAW